MFVLALLVVLAVVAFGITSAVLGRGRYRWLALASGVFALLMLVAAAVLLLGSGAVAIGTAGSLARVLIMGCVVSMVIACILCIIFGRIAIKRRGLKNAN